MYKKVEKTEEGKRKFFAELMRRIERDQILQLENEALNHPDVKKIVDQKGLIKTYIKTPWYTRKPVNQYNPEYEWYWCSPYLIIRLFHKNEFDISKMKMPHRGDCERMLAEADKLVSESCLYKADKSA